MSKKSNATITATCDVNDFKNAITTCARFADLKSDIMVLRNIAIEGDAKNNKIAFTGYDHRIGIRIVISNCEIEKDFSTTADAKSLLSFMKSLVRGEDQIIKMIVDEKTIDLITSCGNVVIDTISRDDFPLFPEITGIEFDMIAPELCAALEYTSYVCYCDDARPYMGGVFLTKNENENTLDFVATDGHRLANYRITMEEIAPAEKINAIVPQRGCVEILKAFKNRTVVDLAIDKNAIQFKSGNMTIVSRLLNAEFTTHWKTALDHSVGNAKTEFIINKEEFVFALKQMTTVCRGGELWVAIEIDESGTVIRASRDSVVKAVRKIASTKSDGKISFMINPAYLIDSLNHETGNEIKTKFCTDVSAIVIQSIGNAINVVMPYLEVKDKCH